MAISSMLITRAAVLSRQGRLTVPFKFPLKSHPNSPVMASSLGDSRAAAWRSEERLSGATRASKRTSRRFSEGRVTCCAAAGASCARTAATEAGPTPTKAKSGSAVQRPRHRLERTPVRAASRTLRRRASIWRSSSSGRPLSRSTPSPSPFAARRRRRFPCGGIAREDELRSKRAIVIISN
uniref:Uncharacterized protein n=1 Tax=Arundo donax TaxID=35708 RepID=A0A0A9D106_ARUDO